jgi:hypothetical protein
LIGFFFSRKKKILTFSPLFITRGFFFPKRNRHKILRSWIWKRKDGGSVTWIFFFSNPHASF